MSDEGITGSTEPQPMSYAKSTVPLFGSLIDYLDIGYHYLTTSRSFTSAEKLQPACTGSTLSASFLGIVCLIFGLVANVKLEAVRFDENPLNYDLHFMLMSKKDNIYIDEIDPSRVMWCLEASDFVVLLISCLLIWGSAYVKSPLSEYLYLPWLGVMLRGLILRQAPTVSALVYTMAAIDKDNVNMLFVIAVSFLFLMEARVLAELTRVLRARWERRGTGTGPARAMLQTLFTSEDDDVLSVEMRNFIY